MRLYKPYISFHVSIKHKSVEIKLYDLKKYRNVITKITYRPYKAISLNLAKGFRIGKEYIYYDGEFDLIYIGWAMITLYDGQIDLCKGRTT